MNVTIPTKWKDITVGNYINLRPVLNSELTAIQRVVNILAVLTGEKKEVIKNISLDQYKEIKKKMSFLDTELPKQLKEKRFKIGGKWYVFELRAQNLLFGEYINIMEIMEKAKDNEEVIFDNLHTILTTVCRPVKRKLFSFKKINVDAKLIRETSKNFFDNMPITVAYPISVFFFNHLEGLTKAIKTCLMEEVETIKRQVTNEMSLLKDGDGGQH
tara:strand:- start:337 stop:981 length:645 start_codon:yes stop_codon:yes gene_type:complete